MKVRLKEEIPAKRMQHTLAPLASHIKELERTTLYQNVQLEKPSNLYIIENKRYGFCAINRRKYKQSLYRKFSKL
jgi:hypothetical protein